METDSYYEIGSSHIYCQDYARTGKIKIGNSDCSFIVVSDGCSSSKDSDLGARFWAQKFPEIAQHLAIHEDIDSPIEQIFLDNLKAISNSPLDESFDATIVGALYDSQTDILYTAIVGDGKIIYHNPEFILVESMNFASNAPYYPTYHLDPDRAKGYEASFGKEYGILSRKVYSESSDAEFSNEYKLKGRISKFQNFSLSNYTGVSVTTDGLDTFYKKEDKSAISFDRILKEVTSFKMLQGKFVERRMLGFKKFCRQNGIEHYDDIAVASMMK